jgi:hypothetical protein
MNTIWKYPLRIADFQEVRVKLNGIPIHAGLDPSGSPCVWCEVEEDNTDTEPLHIYIIGTGNPLPSRAREHLGSFVQGPFVWHVYHP